MKKQSSIEIEKSLTEKQLSDYSAASLYIFNGLTSEKDYVVPLFNNNKNLKIINASLSMKTSYGNEELWLDPSNFLQLTQNIRNGFEEYISNYYLLEEIKQNYESLKLEVSKLDANLTVIGTNADFNTIVVTDDLFLFLKKYNIKKDNYCICNNYNSTTFKFIIICPYYI